MWFCLFSLIKVKCLHTHTHTHSLHAHTHTHIQTRSHTQANTYATSFIQKNLSFIGQIHRKMHSKFHSAASDEPIQTRHNFREGQPRSTSFINYVIWRYGVINKHRNLSEFFYVCLVYHSQSAHSVYSYGPNLRISGILFASSGSWSWLIQKQAANNESLIFVSVVHSPVGCGLCDDRCKLCITAIKAII